MFTESFPIILVKEMAPSLAFYRDHLGYSEEYRFPEEGDPLYVGLQLARSHLGVGLDPRVVSGEPLPASKDGTFELWVYAEDCDAAIEDLRAHGVPILDEPVDQPWGERLARVADPDGNRINIASRASQ